MGSGFSKMKKQRKALEEQFSKVQEEMQQAEYKGTAGGGLVEVVMSGERKLKSITIKPECVDKEDIEGLQDLIIGAFEDAGKKIDEASGGMVGGLGGGLPEGLSSFF